MAEVQLALQRGPAGFEKLVVVKLVHESLASQKTFVDMLLDEARVAALVKHPNVVDIYDLGQADGRYFIAMEYLEGEPLLAVLRAGREGKRLDPLSTGRLIADTAEGLDAAHELRSMSGERIELVHHDISLGNIVVLYNGQVKLVDFGVAKATHVGAGPRAKVQGKFSYMAPEKLKGAPGDRRSDIFSLGCVMWEALTLRRLFRGGNDSETMRQVLEMSIQPPSKVNGDVPPEYDAIVMRALDRDPARRHAHGEGARGRDRGAAAQARLRREERQDRALHAGDVQDAHRRAQEARPGGREQGHRRASRCSTRRSTIRCSRQARRSRRRISQASLRCRTGASCPRQVCRSAARHAGVGTLRPEPADRGLTTARPRR